MISKSMWLPAISLSFFVFEPSMAADLSAPGFSPSHHYEQQYTVCVGQYRGPRGRNGSSCAKYSNFDVYYSCGAPPERELARRMCTTLHGFGDARVVRIDDIPGNRCGYLILEVTCYH
jgi:hypothetical protein